MRDARRRAAIRAAPRWTFGALLAAALALLPATAEAQLQARLRLTGAYSNGTPTAGLAATDVYGELRPELILLVGRPTALLTANYAFGGALHTDAGVANNITNRLSLALRLEVDPRTVFTLVGEALESSLGNLLLQGNPADTGLVVLPPGNDLTFTATVRESVIWQAAPALQLTQNLNVSVADFLAWPADTTNVTSDLMLILDRSFRTFSLGGEVRASVYHYGVPAALPSLSNALPLFTDQLMLLAMPRVRVDLGTRFNVSAAVGAVSMVGLSQGAGSTVGVAARASAQYAQDGYTVDLTYSRLPMPSLLIGQTLFNDAVALRGAIPLSTVYRVFVAASAAYTHGSTDLSGGGAGPPGIDSLLADVGLTYQPVEGLELFARYQLLDQMNPAAAVATAPPTGPATAAIPPTVIRHTALLGLSFSYPRAAPTPLQLRTPSRVDGADVPAPGRP